MVGNGIESCKIPIGYNRLHAGGMFVLAKKSRVEITDLEYTVGEDI